MPVDHWMMFSTFAEQRHFVYPTPESYQGVVINGNTAAYAPDGLAAFLVQLTPGIRYVIDPLTHAFQHDPSKIKSGDEVKNSIKRLCEAYGEPVAKKAGVAPVLPKTFDAPGVLEGFVQRCLEFQETTLTKAIEKSDAFKYVEGDRANAPHALVAPYFFMSDTTLKDWLPVCVRSARLARELRPQSRLFISVVISQGLLLNANERAKLIEAFVELPVDGYLLWIDELDEQEAGLSELEAFLTLTRGLRNNGQREVLNLHGGYFSVLAAGALGGGALSAVAHGPEFGEHRGVVPVGGGIPIARYYVPKLHARVKYRDALSIFQTKGWLESAEAFHQSVCNCEECKRVIAGDIGKFSRFGESQVVEVKRKSGLVRVDYPLSDTKARCLQHYLERKVIEYRDASDLAPQALVDDLRSGKNTYEEVLGLEGVAYLDRWEQVLTKQ